MQNYRNVVLYLGFPQKMPTRSPSPSSCVLGKKNVSRVANPMLPGLVVHTRDPVLGRLTQRMSLRIIWALHCVSGEVKKTPSCLCGAPEPLANIWLPRAPRLVVVWGLRDSGRSRWQGLSLPFLQGNLHFTSVQICLLPPHPT